MGSEERPDTTNSRIRLHTRVAVHEIAERLGLKMKASTAGGAEWQERMSEDARRRGVTPDMVRAAVASHPEWWHTISLPYGIKTPGRRREDIQDWTAQAIPPDLRGKTVLDVGAWDGYYSFLCERRGASVLAIDDVSNWGGTSGFDAAKRVLHSKVEYRVFNVENVESMGQTFDVVLFFGVYYHLKNPFVVFEKLARVTAGLLLVEGYFITGGRRPIMRFYPGSELQNDISNWWAGNELCLVSMLKASGFSRVNCVDRLRNFRGGGRILLAAEK